MKIAENRGQKPRRLGHVTHVAQSSTEVGTVW